MNVPASSEELTSNWFSAVLDGVVECLRVQRIGEVFGLGSRIFRCDLRGPQSARTLVVKLWNTDGPAGVGEIRFYRTFGSQAGVRVPGCYHAAEDPDAKRGVLVLEYLHPIVQGDCLEPLPLKPALAMADTLARLHSTWWNKPQLHASEWLPDVSRYGRDADWFNSRRELFNRKYRDRLDGFMRRILERMELLQSRADERLEHSETTLLHGDLHLDNIVFDRETGQPILLDWAQVSKGPAALNVALLILDIAQPSDRELVLHAYWNGLTARGVNNLDTALFRRQLGGALLRLFSTRTCGIARWEPASEREVRMIDFGLQRIVSAIDEWRVLDPDLFR